MVDVSYGYPWWAQYSVQLRSQDGVNIFRYDNAPHHHELPTFPDHKHVGAHEQPEAHDRPDLSDLIEEICAHVYVGE